MAGILVYCAAALAEIAGCFAFWAVLRLAKSPLWLLPGTLSLLAFATLLAFSPAEQAGRAFAVYGGIYIVASLGWLWAVEGLPPDRFDMIGAVVCLCGAAIILWAPRG